MSTGLPDFLCLAVDTHNLDERQSWVLCDKPQGHDGDHGNDKFTWPKRQPITEDTT